MATAAPAVREHQWIERAEWMPAMLSGAVTMGRRVVRPQPTPHHWEGLPGYAVVVTHNNAAGVRFHHTIPQNPTWDSDPWIRCPYGAPGDRLWVRESWASPDAKPGAGRWFTGRVAYRGDGECGAWIGSGEDRFWNRHGSIIEVAPAAAPGPSWGLKAFGARWRASIHMPRWACRIVLEVVDVRVERLQEITGRDVLAEGIDNGKSNPAMGVPWENMQRRAYAEMWDRINAARGYGWDANPWVWVVTFKRVEG